MAHSMTTIGGFFRVLLLFLLLPGVIGCAPKIVQTGKASYYGKAFKNKPTASGQKFKPRKRTAAHPDLPFGTKVRVTNLKNGRSVKVRINDRGPFVKGRIIDLSRGAARRIDMIQDGVVNVRLQYRKKTNK